MEQRFTVDIEAEPERVFELVSDLERYDEWMDIVHRVEPDPTASRGDAWLVTLRAELGPLARSTRLRMVRTVLERPTHVRFERAETDGRDHSPWILDSTIEGPGGGPTPSRLTMSLTYGGRLWTTALAGVLQGQVETATAKLTAAAGGGR